MKKIFEIVDFYPIRNIKNPKLVGSLHVYMVLDGIEIDIRGICVYKQSKTSDALFFKMPMQKTWSQEEKAMVQFPIFSFTSVELMEDLKKFVFDEGKKLVLEKLKEWPQKRDFPSNPIRTANRSVDAMAGTQRAKKGHFKNEPKLKNV